MIVPLKLLPSNSRDDVSSLPKRNKDVTSPDFRIRRGLGPKTQTVLFKLLASCSYPELNLIDIPIHFQRMRS